MNIINLTPHDVVANGVTFPASGEVCRVTTTCQPVANINGVDVVKTVFGEVVGLPDPRIGTIYIVSSMVLQAATGRHDLIAPDTSPSSVIRNSSGQVLGVKRFTI